jgi:hypothetical protein
MRVGKAVAADAVRLLEERLDDAVRLNRLKSDQALTEKRLEVMREALAPLLPEGRPHLDLTA